MKGADLPSTEEMSQEMRTEGTSIVPQCMWNIGNPIVEYMRRSRVINEERITRWKGVLVHRV
uniref:Uncharacterized protein n=1 Tax=Rhizophora mucronata TaxID=61149 RepID=A0A2P2LU72_RHIMU